MNLNNKVVLLTGAASGIGEAIAIRFASSTANLTLIDINAENLDKVAEKCEHLQAKVLKIVTDVTKDRDLKKAVDLTVEEYGKIDVVINSAGISGMAFITDENLLEAYDKVMQVNLRSIVAITNYTAEELIKTKGCIINISSILSKTIYVGAVGYNVAKAGVAHFTKCAALELAGKGVRVNCVSPGPVKTNITTDNRLSQEESDKLWEEITKQSPLKEQLKTEEIAELVFYLASDKAKNITGSDFVIDAGNSLLGWAKNNL